MKEIYDLIFRDSRLDMRRMVLLSCIGAGSTTVMLGIISTAAAQVAQDGVSLMYAIGFLAALLLHVTSLRTVLIAAGGEIETIVNEIRVDLAEQIRNAELRVLENVGRGAMFAALTRHTRTLSQTFSMLVFGAQQIILIVVAGLYLAWLSPLAFIATAVFSTVALTLHIARMRHVRDSQTDAEAAEAKVSTGITELLEGAKEIRMNAARGDALIADLNTASTDAFAARSEAKKKWNGGFVRVQIIFYALIGVTVFAVPLFTDSYHSVVIKVTTTMLFLIGPIGTLAQSLYNVDEARSALTDIQALRRRLFDAVQVAPDDTTGSIQPAEHTIAFEEVSFAYRDETGRSGFKLGPVSLTLHAGETVFVTGGNGSGKSTFLMLLTGLIQPDSGQILIDGKPLAARDYQAYRNAIAVIFYDYHLFRQLYGIDDPDPDKAARLLEDLEISDKVSLCDGAFTTVALSSGQRKRLALTAAEMEDKPILLLDEWAADQDPAFRHKFYGEVLDQMATRHRFRLFVTHDDRWFDRADRILQLVDGTIIDVSGEPDRWAMR